MSFYSLLFFLTSHCYEIVQVVNVFYRNGKLHFITELDLNRKPTDKISFSDLYKKQTVTFIRDEITHGITRQYNTVGLISNNVQKVVFHETIKAKEAIFMKEEIHGNDELVLIPCIDISKTGIIIHHDNTPIKMIRLIKYLKLTETCIADCISLKTHIISLIRTIKCYDIPYDIFSDTLSLNQSSVLLRKFILRPEKIFEIKNNEINYTVEKNSVHSQTRVIIKKMLKWCKKVFGISNNKHTCTLYICPDQFKYASVFMVNHNTTVGTLKVKLSNIYKSLDVYRSIATLIISHYIKIQQPLMAHDLLRAVVFSLARVLLAKIHKDKIFINRGVQKGMSSFLYIYFNSTYEKRGSIKVPANSSAGMGLSLLPYFIGEKMYFSLILKLLQYKDMKSFSTAIILFLGCKYEWLKTWLYNNDEPIVIFYFRIGYDIIVDARQSNVIIPVLNNKFGNKWCYFLSQKKITIHTHNHFFEEIIFFPKCIYSLIIDYDKDLINFF